MRSGCTDEDREADHEGRDQAVRLISINVEEAAAILLGRDEQEAQGVDGNQQAAHPPENISKGYKRRPLIVVIGQFSHQGAARHIVECKGHPHRDRYREQVREQLISLQTGRRVPDKVVSDADGNNRGIHERMSPPKLGAQIIRPIADNRIGKPIDNHRREQGRADQSKVDA